MTFNNDFETWFDSLKALAKSHGEFVADRDAWEPCFEEGQSIEDAFYEEYPEHAPKACDKAQHSTPCKECPWKRKSLPGWLGASQPGEFLAQSDSGLRMPCHLHVDYDSSDWEAQTQTAPQCAGRAIFQANRLQKPLPGHLTLPANHADVFTRPHEFVAHHARKDPKALEGVMVYDLYAITKING